MKFKLNKSNNGFSVYAKNSFVDNLFQKEELHHEVISIKSYVRRIPLVWNRIVPIYTVNCLPNISYILIS